MQLNVELEEYLTRIRSNEDDLVINIYDQGHIPASMSPGIGILLRNDQIIAILEIKTVTDVQGKDWDRFIWIQVPADLEMTYVLRGFINTALRNNVKLPQGLSEEPIPSNMRGLVADFVTKYVMIINRFGIDYVLVSSPKNKPAKVQHRWSKTVSQIPFFVQTLDSQAEIQWLKRNEMVVKAGATMKKETPVNKDGSFGFAAKMGQKIRDDHQNSFDQFVTTEDIVFKSVNEVSLFLYFAGTNSWLLFKDAGGKTIDAWTRVD